ncbi:MAG: hypothetical protein M3Q15_03040 [Pseudomonadota bacterium]|nr:hypothetical protein [Pseudomonadota bacterium]
MKIIIIASLLAGAGLAPSSTAIAQTPAPAATPVDPFAAIPAPRPADVTTADALLVAVYDVISGDKGVKRDWDRFRSLFHPGARMIPTGVSAKTGKAGARMITPEEYIKSSGPYLEGEGFHEVEVARRIETYGTLAHVFSTYAARHSLADPEPFLRGINSIQLLNDGTRWWVLSIAWSAETPASPLPDKYLTAPTP